MAPRSTPSSPSKPSAPSGRPSKAQAAGKGSRTLGERASTRSGRSTTGMRSSAGRSSRGGGK